MTPPAKKTSSSVDNNKPDIVTAKDANQSIRTQLAKIDLSKDDDRPKFLSEKQELLKLLAMMQEQQKKMEGQEAKLREDLSSYANKYDECKAVISKGMDKFQAESKLMMKQIEKSRSEYRALLSKYEVASKRLTQLLTEKQSWERQLKTANKKVEALEKLCRALQQRQGAAKEPEQKTSGEGDSQPGTSDTAESQPETSAEEEKPKE